MKILIVDDHPVFREGFAALLEHAAHSNTVLQAGSVKDGLAMVESSPDLDVVMLDLMMPNVGGFPAIAEFGNKRPDLPVIVLSSSEDPKDARQALALGALGYVPKSATPHVLMSAINLVMNGDVYVPPLILENIADGRRVNFHMRADAVEALTTRQVDVLKLLSQGLPNKSIATSLDLSEKTVKAHITAIFKALNVVNRTQAANAGREVGLI